MRKYYAAMLFLALVSSNTFAANAWYKGKVLGITTYLSDGSFQIRIDNPTIKSLCKYDRVDFKVSDMGLERTKLALSMALTAFAAGKDWGVVIDMPATEKICSASSTASQGASID